MKKTEIILVSIIIILSSIAMPKLLTGKTIEENKFSYTTAICNEDNYCEDYYIECKGKELYKLTPTGFSIKQTSEWKDNRELKNFCE